MINPESIINSPENQPIELTKNELNDYINRDINDPELLSWMKEKGIEFDNGNINVTVDGVKHTLRTSKEDFGTLSYPETEKE